MGSDWDRRPLLRPPAYSRDPAPDYTGPDVVLPPVDTQPRRLAAMLQDPAQIARELGARFALPKIPAID